MGQREGHGQLGQRAADVLREPDELLDGVELGGVVARATGRTGAGVSAARPADRSTGWPLRYLPVRKPEASGLQVSTPMP